MGKKDTVKLNAKKRNKGVISKKTKEQNRQGRKDAKANALLGNYKKKEIPDIPNLAPFKEKLDNRIKAMKLKEEKQQKRNEFFAEREKKQSMLDLIRDAEKRQRAFDVKERTLDNAVDTNFEALPDSSKRAYYREFKKVVEASDVILEVLDARDPLGCRCKSVEQLILAKDPNKKIILVLNKIDLVPKSVVEKWLKHFRNEYPTIAFKCSTSTQRTNLGQSSVPVSSASNGLLNTSDCLGASTLVQLLKNYSRSINIKTAITVGIIGYPNVGKSSLINSLKRSKAVGVGAMPGFTKVMQEIQLDKKVKLLDCPGIVFASGDDDGSVLLRNCVKIENIPDPIRPIECIMKRCKTQQLMELYKLDPFYTPVEFLSQLARKRGKLKPGGIPDYVDSARLVLRDWNTGKIPYYTVPPEPDLSVVGDVEVVTGWAKEFNIDALLADDAETLKLLSNDMEGVQYLEVDSLSASDNNFSSNVNQFAQEIEMENDDEEDNLPSNNNGNDDMIEELQPIEHKTKVIVAKPVKLADSEDLFNPQRNRNQRKQQKKAKKLRKKGTDMNDNGNFEVNLDFSAMNFNNGGDDDDDDDVLLGI